MTMTTHSIRIAFGISTLISPTFAIRHDPFSLSFDIANGFTSHRSHLLRIMILLYISAIEISTFYSTFPRNVFLKIGKPSIIVR
ncbi:MAG: hypothetical protein PWP51_2740 [Clostridiales bacterium]|jgi:hypothetical protein|nr:hypothetical protein [Clostridiales bacterium]MDN5300187.1 hypothetical protein [Clostridiales bacterium]